MGIGEPYAWYLLSKSRDYIRPMLSGAA
jgi:hypothetical protein